MTVFLTLTRAGEDSGPFDLYSDVNQYDSAFESGVDKNDLLSGYSSSLVPDFTNIIRIKSNGLLCKTQTDVVLQNSSPDPICTNGYIYNIDIFDCNACTLDGGGSISNLYPLTVGKYYLYPILNKPILIKEYVGCAGSVFGIQILDIDQKDTCAEINCLIN